MWEATFFFTLATGPRRSLSLKLRDARVCEPQIRARLGITALYVTLEGTLGVDFVTSAVCFGCVARMNDAVD